MFLGMFISAELFGARKRLLQQHLFLELPHLHDAKCSCTTKKLESSFSALGSGTQGMRLWVLLSLAGAQEAVVCLRATERDHTALQ